MATIKGLKKLSDRLNQLEKKLAGKTLRKATRLAMLPVQREAKAKAPVGKKMHKTYKGSQVAPGFLKRSVRLRTSYKRGRAVARLGVLREAFYGVSFLDEGVTVKKRRRSGKGSNATNSLKSSYRLRGSHWLLRNFLKNRSKIENELRKNLKKEIDKVL